jgi:hypothetical protein
MKNGKRVFDGMRGKGRDESPIGWLLSAEEMAVFEKWYAATGNQPNCARPSYQE